MVLTKAQEAVVLRTNKYGVVYDVHITTARNMADKGLIKQHRNFYGQTHGYKLTTLGFAEKRRLCQS